MFKRHSLPEYLCSEISAVKRLIVINPNKSFCLHNTCVCTVYHFNQIKSFYSTIRNEQCCHLLTLMSFQTCISFFLMLNTEEDILKNFEEPTVVGPHELL